MIAQANPTLSSLSQAHIAARCLARNPANRLFHSVRLLEEHLGRPATAADLDATVLNPWLSSLASRYAAYTVWQYRADILVLWRRAAAAGLCGAPSGIKLHKPKPLPVAWTAAEIAAIVAICRDLPGRFPAGSLRAIYCQAIVLVAWDTGLRRSDLWKLDRRSIRGDGTILLRQHKTGWPHFPRLRTATVDLVDQLPGERPLANPYRTERAWYRFWRRCVTGPAGVRPGCLQQLRRSGATHLAIEHPEAVQRYLGHASPEMAAWYVDWSIARPQQFLPPEIT